ncbi:LysE family translocator [Paracoccaceae bacterium Fryx2]|nr:LysE family translocator [Paracoccaceae bacterium Fryx2]
MIDLLLAMPPQQFFAFLVGGLVVNFAPGADMIFATACGIQGGPRVGAMAGFGAGVGVLWHITLAALGVSALIAAHPAALDAVRWIGAGYLLWLAVKSWRAGGTLAPGSGTPSAARAFRRGILSNVLNPKPVLFILAFLPQFIDPALGPVWQQIVALGCLFAFTGALVTAGYGVLAGYAGRALGARMGALNKLAALLFGGLAAKLVLD